MPSVLVTDSGSFHSTIEEILKELSNFSTHSIIECITMHTVELLSKNQSGNPVVNIDSLNKLSLLCIRKGENNGKRVTLPEFHNLNQMVNSLGEKNVPENHDEDFFLKFNIQVGYNQFLFNQTSLLYKINNFWFLYKESTDFKDDDGKSLNSYFLESATTKFENYAAIVYFLHVIIHEKGTFRLNYIESLFKKPEYYLKFLEILNTFSKNLTELHHLCFTQNKYHLNSDTLLNFNILRDYPIIHVSDDRYICPIPHYWTLKFGTEIYYTILSYYAEIKKQQKPSSTNFFDNRFSNFYGKALENLLNHFIEILDYKIKRHPEFQFKRGSDTIDSADYHLYQNNFLYLIQLKNKRIVLRAQSGDLDSYFKDIESAIIKPYKQSLKLLQNDEYIKELRSRMTFHQIQTIIIVIIYPEDIHGIHLDKVQSFIQSKVAEEKSAIGYNKSYHLIDLFITIEGFEIMLELAKYSNKKLIKIINEYNSYRKNPKILSSKNQAGEILYSVEEYLRIQCRDISIQSKFTSENFKEFSSNTYTYVSNSLNIPTE